MQQQEGAPSSSSTRPTTRIDDQYLRFLWKILIEQEGVVVGRVVSKNPKPSTSIPPAPSSAAEDDDDEQEAEGGGGPSPDKKGKGKEKEEQPVCDPRDDNGLPLRKKIKGILPGMKGKATAKRNPDGGDIFELLEPEEYLDVKLDDLKEKYQGLRIALDGNKMFYVLTGKYPGVSRSKGKGKEGGISSSRAHAFVVRFGFSFSFSFSSTSRSRRSSTRLSVSSLRRRRSVWTPSRSVDISIRIRRWFSTTPRISSTSVSCSTPSLSPSFPSLLNREADIFLSLCSAKFQVTAHASFTTNLVHHLYVEKNQEQIAYALLKENKQASLYADPNNPFLDFPPSMWNNSEAIIRRIVDGLNLRSRELIRTRFIAKDMVRFLSIFLSSSSLVSRSDSLFLLFRSSPTNHRVSVVISLSRFDVRSRGRSDSWSVLGSFDASRFRTSTRIRTVEQDVSIEPSNSFRNRGHRRDPR